MPSVSDYEKFLNGEISKDDIMSRLDSRNAENPLQDWNTHDRTTGMYDSQRSFNTTVGLNEDQQLHDRSLANMGGASVADYSAFLFGTSSATDLRAKISSGTFDAVSDGQGNDRATGLYDNQRGLATNYGLDREQLDNDISTGRFEREHTFTAPMSATDPMTEMRKNDVVSGRDQPTTNTPSYSDYNTFNSYGASSGGGGRI